MKISTTLGLASGLIVASAFAASATTTLSATVITADCDPNQANLVPFAVVCGANPDANGHDRTNSAHVNLGAADVDFYSLGLATDDDQQFAMGYGGSITLEITPAFTGPAMVFEVTNPSNHWEAAEVWVSNDLMNLEFAGLVTNGKGGSEAAVNSVSISGIWKYITIVDYSIGHYGVSGSVDGFDLDAIKVSAVPVPAGALLLGTALAGFGFARRKS